MSSNIVGGEEARPNSWPWMAEVIKTPTHHYCGGALLDEQWVVSAAHCFKGHISEYWFSLGGHWSASYYPSDYETNRQTCRALKIIQHPNYDENVRGYDIALVKLAEKVTFNDYAQPVCLPDKRPDDGQMVYVTGWGDVEYEGSSANKLRQVSLPIVSDRECEWVYGRQKIDDTMICAGTDSGGKDSCNGDSGGPMVEKVVQGSGFQKREFWALVGIVSWGSGCGYPGIPGVYTDVDNMRSWIEDTMANN
ncbi:plasma kallikrein-like isoform X2 [Lytechinus variegatus]|nr:plasma kallikrein-like isoform X2 [Lytechinus variegatus]